MLKGYQISISSAVKQFLNAQMHCATFRNEVEDKIMLALSQKF